MAATTDEEWEALTDEQRANRVVAARAVLREAIRLVGVQRTAELVLRAAGRE